MMNENALNKISKKTNNNNCNKKKENKYNIIKNTTQQTRINKIDE